MAESERGVTNSRLLRLRLLNAVCVEWFVVSVCFCTRVLCVVCCPAHVVDDRQKAPQLSSVWPERTMCV